MAEEDIETLKLEELDGEDEEGDYEEESEEEDDDDINLADLFQTFFAGENNKNMVDTLSSFKKLYEQHVKMMETQNKILMKMANTLDSMKKS